GRRARPTQWRRAVTKPAGISWRDGPSWCLLYLCRDFDRHGGGFAAADAEAGNAPFQAFGLQRRNQGGEDARTRSADRMAKRTGAAMNVEAVGWNVELAHRRQRHHSESFVDLKQIDIAHPPADAVEQLSDGEDG